MPGENLIGPAGFDASALGPTGLVGLLIGGRGSGPHALRSLEFGPLVVSIGPVIGPVNPGMFRHVLPARTADRTSYQ